MLYYHFVSSRAVVLEEKGRSAYMGRYVCWCSYVVRGCARCAIGGTCVGDGR